MQLWMELCMGTYSSHEVAASETLSQKRHAERHFVAIGFGKGDPAIMEAASLQDYVVQRVEGIPGMKLLCPDGAFYALPDVSAFFGPGVSVEGFGAVEDADTLCR